jgi:hypothetical protein
MVKSGKVVISLTICFLFITGCLPIIMKKKVVEYHLNIESMTSPALSKSIIRSVAIQDFEVSSGVKPLPGYGSVGSYIAALLMKNLYNLETIEVKYLRNITRTREVFRTESSRGDIGIKKIIFEKETEYGTIEYPQLDALLAGRVLAFKYNKENVDKSFIDLEVVLFSHRTKNILWMSNVNGPLKDVLRAIVNSIESATPEARELRKKEKLEEEEPSVPPEEKK